MSEILVDVKNLSKEYKRGGETLVVLDDLNLEIPKQDYLALMGPSGSGKSTLLNLIGGLDTPSSGSVSINGERIDQMKLQHPQIVGFGIGNAKTFEKATQFAKGAIIGSAFIKHLTENGTQNINSFVDQIRKSN